MDTLKLAFDTLIIGALALPWLALFMRLSFEAAPKGEHDQWFPHLAVLPEHTREAVVTVLIVAIGYFLGSAVARVSSDFFDDSDVFLNVLPTEDSIRQGIYEHEYCDQDRVIRAANLTAFSEASGGKAPICPLRERQPASALGVVTTPASDLDTLSPVDYVAEFFRLQESKMLLQGEDKIGRLRQLHEQIEILRSSTLNGAILFFLFLFGLCAFYRFNLKLTPRNWRLWLTYVPAATLLGFGGWALCEHFIKSNFVLYESHRDPPLAELVLLLLGAGGFLVRHGNVNRRVFHNGCLVAAVLTATAYGAWWWTETLYDQQIIHSYPVIVSRPAAPSEGSIALAE